MVTVSQRLLQLRNERNLTQKDIIKDIGISLRAYRYYEHGDRNPDSETLIKLCEYFQCSSDYLLGLSDNPNLHKL